MLQSLAQFENCLLGGAIGDALGWPVEFKDVNWIFETYGPKGIQDYPEIPAKWTDDTQMTLFTAEGLLRSQADEGTDSHIASVKRLYISWLQTQTHKFEPGKNPHHSLLKHKELWRQMAPGTTCLSALRQHVLSTNGSLYAENNSKGCGGVMRVAPVGLCFSNDAYDIGCKTACITHNHYDGFAPAGFLAELISQMIHQKKTLEQAVEIATTYLDEKSSTSHLINKAVRYAEANHSDHHERIIMIGEGWTGDEAIAISLYCALIAKGDFELGLRAAVNHGGDTDSTGAIYGNIVGANGIVIPKKWIENLELASLIKNYAMKLCDVAEWRNNNRGSHT